MNKIFLLPAEIWADIEGYEGLYQASNLGRIRSLDRMVKFKGGLKTVKGKIRKPFSGKDGYQLVQLSKNGNTKTFQVHRLVYAAFNGEIPPCMEVNHINECKTDNRLENLNLMTRKENVNYGTGIERHAKSHSKQVVGYDAEGNVIVTFPSIAEAGRNGYNSGNISSCCSGKKYYHRHKGLIWKYKDDGDC